MAGFYRFGGLCRECPANATTFLLVGVLAVVAVVVAVHFVLKLGVSLAAVTIAVDYFQVLSNFGKFDVHWPRAPREMLKLTAFFDLNVDAAAPECFVGVNYMRDWLAVAALPYVCALLLALYHLAWRLTKGCRASRTARRRHLENRVGEMLLLLQVMYLALVGKSLEVFNCSELADGTFAMDAAPYIRCWDSPTHRYLLTLTLITSSLYVVGIPLLFWCVLRWSNAREWRWML
ncbi:MAG: hypothetical protein ACK4ZJ_16240, partial [Allorhizobium sp.]